MKLNISAEPLDLFPTRVWAFDLTGLSSYFPQWMDALRSMQEADPVPSGRSNRMGWNSDPMIFSRPEFVPLKMACQSAFAHAFGEMKAPQTLRFELSAWANMHTRGGFNVAHFHGGALLCGAFYLAAPEGSGALKFHDPRIGAAVSLFTNDAPNNGKTITFKPREGSLIVFPNWLMHSVEAHESDETRVCIAMNAMQRWPA